MTYNVAWWDVKPYSTPNHIPNDYFTEIYTNWNSFTQNRGLHGPGSMQAVEGGGRKLNNLDWLGQASLRGL